MEEQSLGLMPFFLFSHPVLNLIVMIEIDTSLSQNLAFYYHSPLLSTHFEGETDEGRRKNRFDY